MSLAQKNIVLIGFMGSGKTSLAKLLAQKLGWPCVSTDEKIVQLARMSIEQIFREKGEAYFRTLEAQVIKEVAADSQTIIDCGGGVVLNPDNVKALKAQGIIYFLDVTPATIYHRVQKDAQRPLLKVADPQKAIKELLTTRLPLYQQAADVVVDANDPSLEVPLVEILKRI